MALKLEDCAPQVRARIEAQLAKELASYARTEVTFALCSQIFGNWRIGVPTTDRKFVERTVTQMQNRNGTAAYQTSIGNPPAVMIKITTIIPATTIATS